MTVAPDGKHVYAASNVDDAVAVFARDDTNGQLSFVQRLDGYGADPVEGLTGAFSVIVSPDSHHVYVAGNGSHALVAFSRDTVSGGLTFIHLIKASQWGIEGLAYVRARLTSVPMAA